MNDTKAHAARLKDLLSELIKFSDIERHIFLPDTKTPDRKENDTEHSYNLAMAAWYLCQFQPHLDCNLVIKLALVHDLVEIHAGDVMAIGRTKDEEAQKKQKEAAALQKLQEEWPDFSEMTALITSYERKDTEEARFVYALDKLMPVLLNLLSAGKTWKHYGMKRRVVYENKEATTDSHEFIYTIWQAIKKEIEANDSYFLQENL